MSFPHAYHLSSFSIVHVRNAVLYRMVTWNELGRARPASPTSHMSRSQSVHSDFYPARNHWSRSALEGRCVVDVGWGIGLLQISGSSYLQLALRATSSESSSRPRFIPSLSLPVAHAGPTPTVARSNRGGERTSASPRSGQSANGENQDPREDDEAGRAALDSMIALSERILRW